MSYITDDLPAHSKLDGIWEAMFADDVTHINDPAFVIIESFDPHFKIGPCRWATRGGSLPEKGMDCIIGYDENETPYVVAWWDGTTGIPVGSITPGMLAPGNNGDRIETIGGVAMWVKNCKAAAHRSAGQSMPHAGFQQIVFDTEDYDTDNIVNVGGATPYRFFPQTAGMYMCVGQIGWPPAGSGPRWGSIRKNNADQNVLETGATPSPDATATLVSALWQCSVGDYLELFGYQTSGGGSISGVTGNLQIARICA